MARKHAQIVAEPQHGARLGLTERIELWEDGLRTDPCQHGQYEWWYVDALLEDGATVVVSFSTKDLSHPNTGPRPLVVVDLDLPDGRRVNRMGWFDPREFFASTERCDVRIGDNIVRGDLHDYTVHVELDDVEVDVSLHSTCQPWRPGTGHITFGDDLGKVFAWLPAVPDGTVDVRYNVGGESHASTGNGYHDHNWGNVPLVRVVNNWYWGRGKVGPYTVIAAWITAEKAYGYEEIAVFMLARDGRVIADDGAHVSFTREELSIDEVTGKPVAGLATYCYREGDRRYVLSYRRRQTLRRTQFLDLLKEPQKTTARLVGFDGCHHRFAGEVRLEVYEGDVLVDSGCAPAVWELMYFGRHEHELAMARREEMGDPDD